MNKPYHIVVWDTLNEVFGKEWKLGNDYDTGCTYNYVAIDPRLDINNNYIYISIYIYWESGKIELSYCYSNFEDKDGNYIECEWNGESYLSNIVFDNLESFKQFLEYNKRRFFNE